MPKVDIRLGNFELPDMEKAKEVFRQVRKEYLIEAQRLMRLDVIRQIPASGIRTRTGKILSWQTSYRRKGYAAVRPKPNPGGANGPGAITRYLDVGHGVRHSKKEGYKSRAKMKRVEGRRFYEAAGDYAAALAERFSEEIPEEIAARLEDL